MMWVIPYAVVLRMLSDLPYQKYLDDKDVDENGKKKEKDISLTPQTADDFKKFIQELNEKERKKK